MKPPFDPPDDGDDQAYELTEADAKSFVILGDRLLQKLHGNRLECLATLKPYMTSGAYCYTQTQVESGRNKPARYTPDLNSMVLLERNDQYETATRALETLFSYMTVPMYEYTLAAIMRVTVECEETALQAKAAAAPRIHFETQSSDMITDWKELEKMMHRGGGAFYGPSFLMKMRGIEIPSARIPPLAIAKIDVENAMRLGDIISLHSDRLRNGSPSTIRALHQERNVLEHKHTRELLEHEPFMNTADVLEWRQTSRDCVPGTIQENYLQQTIALIAHLENEVAKGRALTPQEEKAIREYQACAQELAFLVTHSVDLHSSARPAKGRVSLTNANVAVDVLANLSIMKLIRATPSGFLSDYANAKLAGAPMLHEKSTTTSGCSARGAPIISMGDYDSNGIKIWTWDVQDRIGDIGAVFSRSLTPDARVS